MNDVTATDTHTSVLRRQSLSPNLNSITKILQTTLRMHFREIAFIAFAALAMSPTPCPAAEVTAEEAVVNPV